MDIDVIFFPSIYFICQCSLNEKSYLRMRQSVFFLSAACVTMSHHKPAAPLITSSGKAGCAISPA